MSIEAEARERIKWMSREARYFMGAEPAFDASLEYESDNDLTDLGRAVRKILLAEPALIYS